MMQANDSDHTDAEGNKEEAASGSQANVPPNEGASDPVGADHAAASDTDTAHPDGGAQQNEAESTDPKDTVDKDTVDPATEHRFALLEACLPHVMFDGWSEATLLQGAKTLGLPPAEARLLFPKPATDLLACFSRWADVRMLERQADEDVSALRTHEKVARAVMSRFEVLQPHKSAVQQALTVWALPTNAADATAKVWATADAIWWFAGDTATDFNHYTKRGLLAGVLGSTTLYWLSDNSEGQQGTEAFLMRRLQDVLKIGKTLGQASRFAPSPAMMDAVKSAVNRFQRGFDRGGDSGAR